MHRIGAVGLCIALAGCGFTSAVITDKPLTPSAFQLTRLAMVGGYAVQPLWGDGHGTGLFAFDYLRKVADSVEG